MEIKRITIEQAELVTGLFNQYRVFYQQKPDLELAEKFISDRLEKNESVIFVALIRQDLQDIPVGFTQLYPKYSSVSAAKNWILNDLYVDYDHRKKGIGEQLIKAAMQFAKTERATYLQLETAQDNQTAKRLYQAIGFTLQEPDTNFLLYKLHFN